MNVAQNGSENFWFHLHLHLSLSLQSYEFKVKPKNELGAGPSSEPVSFNTESGTYNFTAQSKHITEEVV